MHNQYILNFKLLKTELVRAVRGKRTQQQLSRRLGYRFNQVYRFEANLRSLSWLDFLGVLVACGRGPDLSSAMQAINYQGNPNDCAALCKFLLGQTKISEVAKTVGYSRFTVSRWLSGKTIPRLEDVLAMIHYFTRRLTFFIDSMDLDAKQLSSVKGLYQREKRERLVHNTSPDIALVLRCFDLKGYLIAKVHQPGFVANTLGISEAEENKYISFLEGVGAIKWNRGKYAVVSKALDTTVSFEDGKKPRLHWISRAGGHLTSLKNPRPHEAFGYLIFSYNEQTLSKVYEAYRMFYNTIGHLTANQCEMPTNIGIMNVQIFDAKISDGV